MSRRFVPASSWLLCATLLAGCPQPATEEAAPESSQSMTLSLESEDAKTIYAMGHVLSRGVQSLALSEEEVELLLAGFRDAANGVEPRVDVRTYAGKLQEFTTARRELAAAAEKEASQAFLLEAAAEEGASQSESGLVYREISPGEGDSPTATDRVKVHYHGTLRTGEVFDSSRERGDPAVFPLNRVIPCWTEALQKMKPGGKAHIVCPSDIAYGDRGSPSGIAPGAALAFDVELIEVNPETASPKPLAAKPAEAPKPAEAAKPEAE